MKDRTLLIIAFMAALTITACIVIPCWLYNERCKAAFQAGLVEGTVSGHHGIHWVKP